MAYLSVKGYTLSLKNSLENALNEFFKIHDRFIIPDDEIEDYKKGIITSIEEFNRIHTRCKPIAASWWIDTSTKDIHLSGVGPINFCLYKSKN